MKITTEKFELGNTYMISKLYVNGVYQCYIMEDDLDEVKEHGKTAIPRGVYDVIITMSNRFKKPLPLLLKVPNYEGVRIHPGNTELNTEGCLLPGLHLGYLGGLRAVTNSREAFEMLFKKIETALNKGEKVTIELK